MGAIAGPIAAQEEDASPPKPIKFNIPAQRLAQALISYSAATSLELYYNAALAEGRHSKAVTQILSPPAALNQLLEGTGLIPQSAGIDSFILVPASLETVRQKAPAASSTSPYEPFFSEIQTKVGDVLCENTATGRQDGETFLRIWLTSSGVISRAERFGPDRKNTDRHDLIKTLQGLAVAPPPSEMPQPVTLVIFPPASVWKNCRSAGRYQRAD